MNFLKSLFGTAEKTDLSALIAQGALLLDVRTPMEFAGQRVKGSVNIPLDQLPSQLGKVKGKKHIIVFCQSGGRSRQAKTLLERNGFTNVTNGGGWQEVARFVK